MKKSLLLLLFFLFSQAYIFAQHPWVLPYNDFGGGRTYFIKTIDNTTTSIATVGSYGLAVDNRGYIYIGGTNRIQVISPVGYTITATYTSGSGSPAININEPVGFAVSPDNRFLYVSNYNNSAGTNSIAVFNISVPGTITPVKNININNSGNPGWMAIDDDGTLFMAVDGNNGSWVRITNPSTASPGIFFVDTSPSTGYYSNAARDLPLGIHSIALDPIRNLIYVSSQAEDIVQVWSTTGVQQNVLYSQTPFDGNAGNDYRLHGITLSPDGNSLYVTYFLGTSNTTGRVYRYNTVTTGLPSAGQIESTDAVTNPINLGHQGRMAPVTPDGAKLYVFGGTGARELNPTTLALVTTLNTVNTNIDPHGGGYIMHDYGDAPASYGRAAHSLSNQTFLNGLLKIGSKVDGDITNSTESPGATTDDANATNNIIDDEDAFAGTNAPEVRGNTYTTAIPVLNNTGSTARLVVWVDFNRDGDFADAGETSALQTVSTSGTTQFVPVSFSGYTASPGSSFMRIRLTTDAALTATASAARDGIFMDGEVEDFPVLISHKIDPDFNSTYVNDTISGNLTTNDNTFAGSKYGSPTVPAGITNPSGAVPVVNENGTYTFTSSVPGVFVFDVPVCASGQSTGCLINRLTITVADPSISSNPPVANVDLATTSGTTPVTLKTLANDKPGSNSPALDPTTVAITTAPKNGTAVKDPVTGDITYTPNAGFTGNDTLFYSVCDRGTPPKCATSYQVITVDAAGTNNTSASDDYNTTHVNIPVSGNVLTNDVDAQGNTQTVQPKTETITGKGTISIASDGSYTFTPDPNFTGPVSYTYNVCDNGTPQACENATVYLLVQPGNPLPVGFNTLEAIFKDGQLIVNWGTDWEKNCKEYVIEGSVDGSRWQEIGRVSSKAVNGNSDVALRYEFATSGYAIAGIGLLFTLLLIPAFKNRKAQWLLGIICIAAIAGCSKKVADELQAGKGINYIRIVQYDMDGTAHYSNAVKVIKR